jgi:hypothetical protein
MIELALLLYIIIGALCGLMEFGQLGRGATWLGVFMAILIWPIYLLFTAIDAFDRRGR